MRKRQVIRPLREQDRYTVGEKVRYFRRLRGWSQKILSEKVFVVTGTIGMIETGKTMPSLYTISVICKVLDVGLSRFFEDVYMD